MVFQKAFIPLIQNLPLLLQEHTLTCLTEHHDIVSHLLSEWYIPEELFFRDFLSGPKNQISADEVDLLVEAMKDVRYELVPTVRFTNTRIQDSSDTLTETSALVIEFHTRGMAF